MRPRRGNAVRAITTVSHEHDGPFRSVASAARSLILHVVSSTSEAAGGPAYTVPALANAQAAAGEEVALVSLGNGSSSTTSGVRRETYPPTIARVPVLRKLGASFALRRALSTEHPHIIHSHGLWQLPGIHAAAAARRCGVPLVVAPRGMLSSVALSFSAGPKQIFSALWQSRALRDAQLFHATAVAEYEDIRSFGLRQPVAIIPNGVDLPELAPRCKGGAERTVLYLGRLHPKKGLETLLQAWAAVEPRHPDWRLRIIGPDEAGHAAELRAMAAGLRLRGCTIADAAYGAAKWAEYRAAHLFVLPTLNENFAVTVAESLAAEVPVISTKGAPWAGLETHRCGWWIDHGPAPLAAALDDALALDEATLHDMGCRGRAWMQAGFSWDRVAADMLTVYRWLRDGGEAPANIRMD